jgi:hypothetical protein
MAYEDIAKTYRWRERRKSIRVDQFSNMRKTYSDYQHYVSANLDQLKAAIRP